MQDDRLLGVGAADRERKAESGGGRPGEDTMSHHLLSLIPVPLLRPLLMDRR